MPDTVGGLIESWCTKCRNDTEHIVVALKDGKAKRVECKVCEGQHNWRKPKGAEAAAAAQAKAAERKSARKAARKRKDPLNPQREWKKLMEAQEGLESKGYAMAEMFELGEVLDHPKFGKGVITEVLTATKFACIFEEGRKVLAMNID